MWIKICGIKTVPDASSVIDAGADAVGLNFYPRSRRYIPLEQAKVIADHCRDSLELVGVFVNASPADVARIAQGIGLTAVQFHGDESPGDIRQFQADCPGIPVIRAFRVGQSTRPLAEQIQDYAALTPPLSAALVDAWSTSEYGGTGEQVATDLLEHHQSLIDRMVLAGGLKPGNVAEAIKTVQPWGVDTASGVESSPGVKSAELIDAFVASCRSAAPDSVKVSLATT